MKPYIIFNFREFFLLPLLLIFFGFIEILRDLLNLPFFGDRLYLLYIFIFFILFYFQLLILKYSFIYPKNIESYIFYFILFFFIIDFFKKKDSLFLPLQLFCVTISIYLYHSFTKKLDNSRFFSYLKYLTYLITTIIIFIWAIWYFVDDSFQDLKTRNSLPYIILGIYLFLKFNLKNSKKIFLCFIIVTLICETKGAFVLYCILFFLEFFKSKFKLTNIFNIFLILISFLSPFIVISFFNYKFNSNYDDLIELDKYRYYIRDDISSFISRILGSGYLLIMNFKLIFPLGIIENLDKEKLIFWGYPIHNYLYLLIIQYGLLGIFFNIYILILINKMMFINISLGFSLLFCLLNFNDFYIGFIIFLLPLLNNQYSRKIKQLKE
jgi:hypothetical protein